MLPKAQKCHRYFHFVPLILPSGHASVHGRHKAVLISTVQPSVAPYCQWAPILDRSLYPNWQKDRNPVNEKNSKLNLQPYKLAHCWQTVGDYFKSKYGDIWKNDNLQTRQPTILSIIKFPVKLMRTNTNCWPQIASLPCQIGFWKQMQFPGAEHYFGGSGPSWVTLHQSLKLCKLNQDYSGNLNTNMFRLITHLSSKHRLLLGNTT